MLQRARWWLATGAAAAAAASVALVALALRRRRRSHLANGAECGKDCGCQSAHEIEQCDAANDALGAELEDLAAEVGGLDPDRPLNWGAGQLQRSARSAARGALCQTDENLASAGRAAIDPQLPGRQRIFVKTYGCAHNNSDSEFMMGLLRDYGYTFADTLEDADACIINSCTVKSPSQDNATNLTQKAKKAGKAVVLAGCVPSSDSALVKSLEGVSMLGVTQLDRVVEVTEEALRGHVVQLLGHRRAMPSLDLPKVRKNRFVEIIPISGGCLGNCSYCKTKHARGKLSSYTEDAIVGRALQAASEGVSEVWLTSEDTGAYGLDIGTDIGSLLHRVSDSLPSGIMLKLGMTNPPYMLAHIEAVAAVMSRPNVFAFIHIPVQSGSDPVLQSMVREYTAADFKHLVDGLRARVPDIMVATDIICGFPAEAEEDHKASLELVETHRFPVLNISQFYPRPGTPAARMRKLPSEVVKRRSTEMTQLFDSYETNSRLAGREERAWFSDTDYKHKQTVGHTKGYVKVVVPRDDSLLGKSKCVLIGRTTKWHVEGTVLDKGS